MNLGEDDNFKSDINEAFEYIRPESRKILLGWNQLDNNKNDGKENNHLPSQQQQQQTGTSNNINKRKTSGFSKNKTTASSSTHSAKGNSNK